MLRTALVLMVLIAHLATGSGFAQTPPVIELCTEDVSTALPRALSRHAQLIEELLSRKGIRNQRRFEPTPAKFSSDVLRFLDGVANEGLLLYALDTQYLCAFLWVGDHPMVYARTPNKAVNLEAPTFRLAASIIAEGSNRSASVKARIAQLRKLPEVKELFRAPAGPLEKPTLLIAKLSSLLFPPLLRSELANVQHLSIVPVGAISSMPISILRPLGTNERVVDRFSVNFLLFASAVSDSRKTWSADFKSPLVLGNPTGRDKFFSAAPLPAAEQEARYVAAKYRVEPVIGAEASTAVIHARARKADLIYLATHGVSAGSRRGDPLRDSFVVLSDDRLSASTIISIGAYSGPNLQARLVVLSACQSGLGWVTEGGVVGLARTFLDGGAGNVIMTTWNVDDNATGFLMKAFVDLLDRHQPAEAMRHAQLAAMVHYKDLVYWSAFNVYGNPFVGAW